MIVYLDTSVVLRVLLRQGKTLPRWGKWERAVGCIGLTRLVLRRAAQPMATAVKTLDAIHLASALLFQERRGVALVFATHDMTQATAAKALGLEVIGC